MIFIIFKSKQNHEQTFFYSTLQAPASACDYKMFQADA